MTQTIARQLEDDIKLFSYGLAERSYGWEYLVLSNDEESTGYPIEPFIARSKLPGTGYAYLVDWAGIIWALRQGVFKRHCKGASLAYIVAYFGSSDGKKVDKLALEQHNKWCLAAGESDES